MNKTQASTGGATEDGEALKTGSGLSRNGERAVRGPARNGGWGRGFTKERLTEMPERSLQSQVFKDEWELASSEGV